MNAQLNTYDMNRVNLWEHVPLDTPFQLSIEPTFACNFRCDYCMHALDRKTLEKRGFEFAPVSWDNFKAIVEQLQEFPHNIKKASIAGYGEPTLDERLPEMIHMIMDTGKVDKTIVITNGFLLTPKLSDQLIASGLSELKISLQGMNASRYQEVSHINIDFEKYVEQIRYFSKHRNQCKLRLKIADLALADGEEDKYYSTFGDICDFISIEHIYPQFRGVEAELMPNQGKNRFGFQYARKNVCATLFFKLGVRQNGVITFGYPDGITYEGFHVAKMSLAEAWNSPERKRLLYDNLVGDRSTRECCNSCTRWPYSVTPSDDLDGHEGEILQKLDLSEYNVPRNLLRKEILLCYDGQGMSNE